MKDDIARTSDWKMKATLESNLRQAEAYLQELKSMKPTLPTRTITTTVTLNEGGRDLQLHLPGRGHTDGDRYTYLPKEKVLITGDAVVGWMPFVNDGFPDEWPQTLAALEKLDISQLILGHGNPAPKEHLAFFRAF